MHPFAKISITLITLPLLVACNTSAFMRGNELKDKDWNRGFDSNCPLPHYKAIQWMEEEGRRFLRFTLNDGDKGGCVTDRKARNNAPYWERAEVAQMGLLSRDRVYTIEATLRIVEGFRGRGENFFQIHGYDKTCKGAYPPITVRFDNRYSETQC